MGIPQSNEKIITPKKHSQFQTTDGILKLKTEVLVIGSGAGGAVAAAELAKKGKDVILIEEGSYFNPTHFTSDEFISQKRLYRDAGFIITENQTANIIQGRALGGSTVVNWQTSLYPPEYVTDEWDKRFGLKGYSRKEMSPYIDEIHKRINVHEVLPNLINANNSVLRKGGTKLGLHPQLLSNNNIGCIGLGRCGLGCPINAKQSMFLSFIPDAIENGARVFTNMRAVKIKDGVEKLVTANFEPDPMETYPNSVLKGLEIQAKQVIVSAGAVEGPALLLRSGLGNEWVGRNFKIHPTSNIFAIFDEKINMFSGPPQSVVIKDGHNQNDTGYGFWLEVSPFRPTSVSVLIPFYGEKQFELLKKYPYMNSGLVLVRDGADKETNGKIEWSFGKRKVFYEITKTDGLNLLKGLKMLAEVQIAAGAKELIFPFPHLTNPIPANEIKDLNWILEQGKNLEKMMLGSAHPHGSIQAANSPKLGAISPEFELYGHKGIYVMDASFYPTGLSVNPQITTMSSVLRASRNLV
jgi:choline dehydrogenase-like flavoprotein